MSDVYSVFLRLLCTRNIFLHLWCNCIVSASDGMMNDEWINKRVLISAMRRHQSTVWAHASQYSPTQKRHHTQNSCAIYAHIFTCSTRLNSGNVPRNQWTRCSGLCQFCRGQASQYVHDDGRPSTTANNVRGNRYLYLALIIDQDAGAIFTQSVADIMCMRSDLFLLEVLPHFTESLHDVSTFEHHQGRHARHVVYVDLYINKMSSSM